MFSIDANGSTTISSLTAGLVRSTAGGSLYTDAATYLQAADLANYSTFAYGSSTYVNFGYATNTFATLLNTSSYTYASSTFSTYGYGSSTYALLANTPTYTYASSSYATKWNLTAGSNVVITTSTNPTIAVSSTPSFTSITATNASTTNLTVVTNAYFGTIQSATKINSTNASSTNLTVATNSYLGTVRSGTWNGSAIDISSYTNLAAGRSLTMSGDSVEADAELFTHTKAFSIRAASGVLSATTSVAQIHLPSTATITKIYCSTNADGATIQFDERATSTPNTAGTDVMTAALNCKNTGAQTTSFSNAGIVSEAPINLDIDLASSTVVRISGYIKYTLDD